MKMINKNSHSRVRLVGLGICILWTFLVALFIPSEAQARIVDEVKVRRVPVGYEVTINFLTYLQYQNHSPAKPSKEFLIQFKTINFQSLDASTADSIRERLSLTWDSNSDIPLQEITFRGDDPERPEISFLFTEEVEIDARGSADLRALVVTVKTLHPKKAISETQAQTKATQKTASEAKAAVTALPEKMAAVDQKFEPLLEEARNDLISGNYAPAIQYYTKILLTAQGSDKRQAQELLGVAHERSGHLALAVAEYKKYLNEFPSGPDADRVKQRLSGLITAPVETAKQPLKEAKRAARPGENRWNFQNYGSFSEIYFRDQTIPQGSDLRLNRLDLSSMLDLNSRLRNQNFDISSRFGGSTVKNFIDGHPSSHTLSDLYLSTKSKDLGLYGKFGRQSLSTGGVLGRFDGVHLSTLLNPVIKMNAVFGYPVQSTHQTHVMTDRRFYGVNFDLGTFQKKWNFNTFFINQDNRGLTDRRAVGGEVRYFDLQKSFFTLLDYDILFNTVNIFLFNGHWTFPTKTTLNAVFDYRKTPLLTINNAIIGQGVSHLADILDRFSSREIRQLANDRTTNSKSATFGVTQELNENLQTTAEFSSSQIEGTMWSEGVEGTLELRPDYTYSLQLLANNFLIENGTVIGEIDLTDTTTNNTYSAILNVRFPVMRDIRLNPRIRVDYRDQKKSTDSQITVRPAARIEYSFTKWMTFELEGGIEWVDDRSKTAPQKSTETYVTGGFRIIF